VAFQFGALFVEYAHASSVSDEAQDRFNKSFWSASKGYRLSLRM